MVKHDPRLDHIFHRINSFNKKNAHKNVEKTLQKQTNKKQI